MHESVDSSIDTDVIPGAAVRGFHAIADIYEIALAKLWPGLDVGILSTGPGADVQTSGSNLANPLRRFAKTARRTGSVGTATRAAIRKRLRKRTLL